MRYPGCWGGGEEREGGEGVTKIPWEWRYREGMRIVVG
jgi:hypothetical protein